MKTKLSIIFRIISILAASIVGYLCMLSEEKYPNVENFSDMPKWYIVTIFTMIGIAVATMLLEFIFHHKISKVDEYIGISLFGLSICLLFSALLRTENNIKDTLILMGGYLFPFALMNLIIIGINNIFINRYDRGNKSWNQTD